MDELERDTRGPARVAARAANAGALAGLAVLVAAVLFLAAGIRGRFESSDQPPPQAPFVPPTSPALAYPTTLEDCEDGGWRNYVQFESEEECKEYVEDNAP